MIGAKNEACTLTAKTFFISMVLYPYLGSADPPVMWSFVFQCHSKAVFNSKTNVPHSIILDNNRAVYLG